MGQTDETITGRRFLPLESKRPTIDNLLDWMNRVIEKSKDMDIPESWYHEEMGMTKELLKQLVEKDDPYAKNKK